MSSTSNKGGGSDTFVLASFGSNNAYLSCSNHYHDEGFEKAEPILQKPRFTERVAPSITMLKIQVPSKWAGSSKKEKLSLPEKRWANISDPLGEASQNQPHLVILTDAKLSDTASENYMTEEFRHYLDKVDGTSEFADGLVTQYVKRLFITIWEDLGLRQIPNPQAMPNEDKALSLVWQDESYQIGIDVYPDGCIDWFWFNLITDEYEGDEGVSISSLPLDLLKRLNTAFIGG